MLTRARETTFADYELVMRCWTRNELERLLAEAGFVSAEYGGGYDRARPAGSTDRLVVVASRS